MAARLSSLPRQRRFCGPLLIAVLLLSVVLAAGRPTDDRRYYARVWTTEDGLPHNVATSILQDTTGYLWIGTTGGLGRFDGRQIREYRPPDNLRTLGYNIRAVAEEKPGTLVVLVAGARLLRFSDGRWTDHPGSRALEAASLQPTELHCDGGVLWLGGGNDVMRLAPDGAHQLVNVERSTDGRGRRRTFATDGAGNLWIGSGGRLLMIDALGGGVRMDTGVRQECVVGEGREGRVWVCTEDELLVVEHGTLVSRCRTVPWGAEFGGIRRLFEDRSGNVWIGSSRSGVFRFRDGRIDPIATPLTSISGITGDREGNLWLASDGGGIAVLRATPYRLYDAGAGLLTNPASSLCEDASGNVLVANRTGGLASISPDGGVTPLLQTYANSVVTDASGAVWFAAGLDGLFRWPREAASTPARLAQPASSTHLLFRARNGDVWFAANGGVVGVYHDGAPRIFTRQEVTGGRDIRAIAQDPRGDIWLGGRDGAAYRWDGTAAEVAIPATEANRPVHAIYCDARGVVWIATARGLLVHEGTSTSVVSEADGLADDIIHQLVEDDEGHLWFASRRGVFSASKSEVLRVARTHVGQITSRPLGRNYGLVGITPMPNYQPGALKTADGTIWFATSQGALAIDPRRLPRDLPAPPVIVEEIVAEGRRINVDNPSLRLSSGLRRIEFHVAVLSFAVPENVLLRHRLDRTDRDWIETGSDRVVTYTNLGPGAYTLELEARDRGGAWKPVTTSLRFEVIPDWWERSWARVAAVILLIAASALVARKLAQRRLQVQLRRLEHENALERERARIARDLHDDLGASLTEVGLVAERLVSVSPPALARDVSSLAWRVRRLATELSGIVWTMSSANSTLDKLAGFLRRYAERLFRNTGTSCVVRGLESVPNVTVSPEIQHQLIAVTREAINNIVKHARATEAVITFGIDAAGFTLRIEDNGIGFDVAAVTAVPEGNGVRNIRLRVEEIGGFVDFQSGPGRGSVVLVRLPAAALS